MSTRLQKLLDKLSLKTPEEINREFYTPVRTSSLQEGDLAIPTLNLQRIGGNLSSEASSRSLVFDQPEDLKRLANAQVKPEKSEPLPSTLSPKVTTKGPDVNKSVPEAEQQVVPAKPLEQKEQISKEIETLGPGFPEEMQDDDLKKALQEQRKLQSLSLLLKGAQQLADAGVTAAGGKPADSSAFFNALDQYAKDATSEVLTRRRGAVEEEELKDRQRQAIRETDLLEQADPNSVVSKIAREFFKKLGQEVPENVSYNNLKDLIQDARLLKQFEEHAAARLAETQARAFERQKYMDMRLDQIQYKKDEDLRQAAERFRNAATRTEAWKQYDKFKSVASTIRQLAKDAAQKGGQSLSMLGPKIAKGIANEVGVLTENDVTRYVQNPALVESVKDTISKIKAGKLSQVSYDNIMRLLEVMEKSSEKAFIDSNYNVAKALAKNRNIPVEQAMAYVDPLFDPSVDTLENYVPLLRRKVKSDNRAVNSASGFTAAPAVKKEASALKKEAPVGMSPEAFERAVQKVMQANKVSREEAIEAIKRASVKR